MIKKLKKGFTLVELIVVIAIIAILSTVAVIGFTRVVDKANVSNDTQLVRNLNERMQLEEAATGYKKPETAHEAFVLTEDFGFIIEKLTPSSSGNDIVWDSTTNRFALIDAIDHTVVYSDPQVTLSTKPVDLWKVYKEVPIHDDQKYSIYLAGTNLNGSVNAKVGVDVGKNLGITEINYTNTSGPEQEVVIRTNASATSLTVNGYVDSSDNTKGDVIKHYGTVGALNVIKCALASYHENGKVAYFEAKAGHIVFEKNSEIKHFHINANDAGTGFEEITLADNGAKELPSTITRGTVTVSQATLVVKIISQGSAVAEEIYVYPYGDVGTTKQTEEQNSGVSSALGSLVLDKTDGANARNNTQRDAERVAAVEEAIQEEVGKQETDKNGLVNGYYYLNNELYTGTITDNNKTIEFENGCLVVWAEDSLQSNGSYYVVNHTFNKSSVDSKYLTDKIVLSSISSVYGVPGSQTSVSNIINIDFEGYSVESAKAYDPSIMYSLSSTPWNNATVYADYMKLISETCGNGEYGDAETFPFYISSKDYTEYNSLLVSESLSVSELTFTDYLKLKYVSNVIVTSTTTAIETYMVKSGSEDKLSAYAYDNGSAGMGIILSKDGNAYFYSWSDLEPSWPLPSYKNISYGDNYSEAGDGYSVDRIGATIFVKYNGTAIDTLTITKNEISDFNLVEQKAAISTKSIADSCSKEELLALATDLGNKTQMRIDLAPEVMELFIKAFWSTYSFSNALGRAACSFDDFNATTLYNFNYEYVVQFVNGIGNAYQEMDHVGPIIKVIISKIN